MTINFPIDPSAQTPTNEFSPTSTPDKSTNGVKYSWDGVHWVASSVVIGDEYVKIVGDNMTGDLTLGTDKITLKTDGRINAVSSFAPLEVRRTDGVSTNAIQQWRSDVNGTDVPVAKVNGDGSFLIGGTLPSAPNISLDSGGTARLVSSSFNNELGIGNYGSLIYSKSTDTARVLLQGSSDVGGVGSGQFLVMADGDSYFKGTMGIGNSPTLPNISLNADGSAEYAGTLQVGGNPLTGGGNSVGAATLPTGTLVLVNDSVDGSGVNAPSLLIKSPTAGATQSRLNNDGSAEFTDQVLIGTDGVTSPPSLTAKIKLNADGSAAFAGEVISGDSTRATGSYSVIQANGIIESVPPNDSSRAVSIFSRNQKQRTVDISASGLVQLGGTQPSAPNISLNATNGNIASVGRLQSGGLPYSGDRGFVTSASGTVYVSSIASGAIWQGYTEGNTTPTSSIFGNGSAQFAGPVSVGGTADANTISEYEEGTWTPTLNANWFDNKYNIGKYTKIGNVVTVAGEMIVECIDYSPVNASVTFTLPFPVDAGNGGGFPITVFYGGPDLGATVGNDSRRIYMSIKATSIGTPYAPIGLGVVNASCYPNGVDVDIYFNFSYTTNA